MRRKGHVLERADEQSDGGGRGGQLSVERTLREGGRLAEHPRDPVRMGEGGAQRGQAAEALPSDEDCRVVERDPAASKGSSV